MSIGIIASQIVTPTGCGITLTNAGLDTLGYAPMTVVGQTVSVTGDGSNYYGMWTGAPGKAVSWTGLRAVEFDRVGTDLAANASLIIFRESDLRSVSISCGGLTWTIGVSDYAAGYTGEKTISGTGSDTFSFAIDGASGDIVVYQNGIPVVDKTTTPSFGVLAGLGGMFAGDSAIISIIAYVPTGDTAQATARTNGTTYTQAYPSGVKDWCGNAI